MSKNNKNAKQAAANEVTHDLTALQNAVLSQDVEATRAELAKYSESEIQADGRLGFLAQAGNNVISTAEKLAKLEAKNAELAANQKRTKAAKVEKTELEKIVSSGARRAALAVIIAPSKSAQEQQCYLNALTLLSNETSLKSGSQRQLVLHARNILEFAKEVISVSDLPQGIQDAQGDIERIATALWDKQIGLDDKGQQIVEVVTGEDKSASAILSALGFNVVKEYSPENLIGIEAKAQA